MKKRKIEGALCLILIIYMLLLPICACAEGAALTDKSFIEDKTKFNEAEIKDSNFEFVETEESAPALSEDVQVGSRLFELFFGDKKKESEPVTLLPGGSVFGMKIQQKYVTVSESKGIPALKSGDAILSIDGKEVKRASDVRRIIENSEGKSLTIKAIHGGNEIVVEIKPTSESGGYRLGLTLRDTAAGLGTVTFIDPKSGTFGGLGHGIIDSASGEIVEMEKGDVCGVVLGGIHKGESGKPGEICGILTDRDLGDITYNGECGVFGTLSSISADNAKAIQIGRRNEICEGEATIISTLKNGKTGEYKIQIYDIDRDSKGSKSFRIRVTDETLKALTGGIIRGMSGSPIIQNGKLVGAVTHVLVADPTEGYGIFIENMLNAANFAEQQKAA